ncbi:formate dehydrogenase subunit alpha [Chitinimonas koreensis]|uniref:formate dehydrogenase subunit alpha n=1 Tax=Chitinimonas koreensis TaxID=356302 RepID=UPI000422A40F|nr:formate dehydrogenase subunit alpha [Chitinimonas koreensis]QNM97896.1 formate dehydrogenase subunit alpha [Chitinimonas koreensis]
MLQVTIDGRIHRFPADMPLLHALQQAGSPVPQLCHDDRLKPYGGCRMCLVEVAGEARPVAACAAGLRDGMQIRTDSPALQDLRHTQLSLLAARYPGQALAQQPELPFHRLLAEHGLAAAAEGGPPLPIHTAFRDDGHPYLAVDMDRCIHCQRCVRICDEVQGQFVWQVHQRGERSQVLPRDGRSLLGSGCTACGACADTCPTGAIHDKRSTTAERWTRSTCVYCGVGCQLEVGSRAGRVVAVRPADSPVNRGHLCVKGRYAFEFNHSPERIGRPMLREGGHWREAGWDEALDYVADRLGRIVVRHGPDSVGVLGSARATNEENYLAQKFARLVLGTNNVDCCARVCHTPSAKALKTMLGTGAATNAFDDIEQARTLLLCGANPTESHPVLGARIKQAVRNGARLIVVDPRRTELADHATVHLALRPGCNVAVFNAMAACIVEEGLVDAGFLAERVTGFAAYREFIRAYRPEAVAQACGLTAEAIRKAARLYAGAGPAMCMHGLGMTEHVQGTDGVMTLINLALLTGNLGKPGSGINPLRGQNNVQGAAHMGCDPVTLPGGQSFEEAAERVERVWGAALPGQRGLDLPGMLDRAAEGQFMALWCIGYDIHQSLANANRTGQALQQLELVIVQDLFLNETAKAFGHVFFPAASVFERDGTFMNADRRVQRIRRAVDPPGEARPDWWIIQELAARMGHPDGFRFDGPQAVWDEVRQVWPAGAGLGYDRLERESINWPCPDEAHPGTPVLHRDRFAMGQRAELACIDFTPTPERCDADYPLLLNTGRTLYHFNAGTMTYRTANAALSPCDMLDMAPADAAALGLADGELAMVRSRYGSAVLPIRLSERIKPGELFTSFHCADLWVNRLTSPLRDGQVHAPEYKVTAVRVERPEG